MSEPILFAQYAGGAIIFAALFLRRVETPWVWWTLKSGLLAHVLVLCMLTRGDLMNAGVAWLVGALGGLGAFLMLAGIIHVLRFSAEESDARRKSR